MDYLKLIRSYASGADHVELSKLINEATTTWFDSLKAEKLNEDLARAVNRVKLETVRITNHYDEHKIFESALVLYETIGKIDEVHNKTEKINIDDFKDTK